MRCALPIRLAMLLRRSASLIVARRGIGLMDDGLALVVGSQNVIDGVAGVGMEASQFAV